MNKKILNFALIIIVILLVIIFGAVYYMLTQNKASNSIYDDVSISNNETNNTLEDSVQVSATQEIELNEDEINKIYPFTGAFPTVDILPFIFDEPITTFSNEQILRAGFAKVTKDDWAPSYVSEADPLSIPASLLDKYIKDVFGQNVQYQKANFSNSSYCIDKKMGANSRSYDITYVPETDTYTIDSTAGDGIGENHVYMYKPMTSKIQGNFEIEIPYVYVVYTEENETSNSEEFDFSYKVYASCDKETKAFSGELGSCTESDDVEANLQEIIDTIDLAKVEKIHLIYGPSEDGTEMVLKEVKK